MKQKIVALWTKACKLFWLNAMRVAGSCFIDPGRPQLNRGVSCAYVEDNQGRRYYNHFQTKVINPYNLKLVFAAYNHWLKRTKVPMKLIAVSHESNQWYPVNPD